VTVVIESIDPKSELKMRGGATEHKPVVMLKGKDKAWVLNKTNALRIAEVYGPEVMKWIGKSVVIKSERVTFGGKTTDAVRVDVEATAMKADTQSRPVPHDPVTGEVNDGSEFDYGPPPMDDEAGIQQ
jgi:hypothetical protein